MVFHQLIYAALRTSSRWHRLTQYKVLLGQAWHVTLIKKCLVAAGPQHSSLPNFRFKVGVFVPKKGAFRVNSNFFLYIGRRHADGAVARMVVGVHQVLDDIHPTHGAMVRQKCLYAGLDVAGKSLHHGRLFLALTGKVLNTVALYQGLKVRVKELIALVGL